MKQLQSIDWRKILFLDIETVPQCYKFEELDEETATLFSRKTRFQQQDGVTVEDIYNERGGILSEFGKIVCISVGFVNETRTGKEIRLKSFYDKDEETLLNQFAKLLNENYASPYHLLCGHNAKEFDFPYIARRMLVHGIALPNALDIAGKKPWEVNHIDTMDLWKFGDYKHYTSLVLLCHIFKIPTPKDDISGADVARVFYEEDDLHRIKVYCEKDVVALIQLFLKYKREEIIPEGDIIFSE